MRSKIGGLEGIALGIIESNVDIVTGYPGGPSTSILEELSLEDIPHLEWSVNEKQAASLAGGASMVGKRAAVVMKHVGMNVASDAVMGMALNGVQGGLVFFVGDDPGGGESQNEQDTRNYADLFNIPMLEPSSVPEAKEMTEEAFELSERFEVPVIVRFVKKLKEMEGEIEISERKGGEERETHFDEQIREQFLIGDVPEKHRRLHDKIRKISENLDELDFNNLLSGREKESDLGIITSGPVSTFVEEEVKEREVSAPVLKIGTLNPFPSSKVRDFLEPLDKVLVVEEVEPWIQRRVACLAEPEQEIIGKLSGDPPREGALDPGDVKGSIENLIEGSRVSTQKRKRKESKSPYWQNIENCPMKKFHGALRRAVDSVNKEVLVTGDTGCSYQGSKEPYETVDSFLCMGASVSMAAGVDIAGFQGETVAVMGDSSFLHSGIQSLMNAVYHGADVTFVIFDNQITGETGRQPNPGTGTNLQSEEKDRIEIEKLVEDCNVNECEVVESFEDGKGASVISSFLKKEGVNVIILRNSCPENCSL